MRDFAVLTAELPAPVVAQPVNGALLKTGTPAVGGLAPAGTTVTVRVDGVEGKIFMRQANLAVVALE